MREKCQAAEIWDAYDGQFHKIAEAALVRGQPIPEGMYHLVCEIIVKHLDGTYLLLQRDLRKHLGGMWELTAGGSALAGETAMECAMRELREESGIVSHDLREIGRIVHEGHRSLYVEYLCMTDWDKQAVTLQPGETIAYRWVDQATLLAMGEDSMASSRPMALLRQLDL